ncbi:protein phnB [Paenibacillus polymyxa]|nr:protein phnB [Paenibacillus polymyxa]
MSTTLEIAIFLSMNGKAKEAIAFYKKNILTPRNDFSLLIKTWPNVTAQYSLLLKIKIIFLILSYRSEEQRL